MRTLVTGLILALTSVSLPSISEAEVTRLGIRFAGGCHNANAEGACIIETVAFGEDFESAPGLELYSAPTHNGQFRKISNFKRKLDEDGRARSRFRNIPGACYQMRLAKADLQDSVSSDILCETAPGEPSKAYPAGPRTSTNVSQKTPG